MRKLQEPPDEAFARPTTDAPGNPEDTSSRGAEDTRRDGTERGSISLQLSYLAFLGWEWELETHTALPLSWSVPSFDRINTMAFGDE